MIKHVTDHIRPSNRLLLAFIVLLYSIPLILFLEEILGVGAYYYNHILVLGVAFAFVAIADRIYVSIHNIQANNIVPENNSITVFNKDMHRICIILIIAVWPLRLPLYYIEHPEWSGITNFDIGLFTAFIIIITLDRLYKNNYMYLYSALLAICLTVYFVALISKSIITGTIVNVLSNLFLIVIFIPIILLLYKIPIKVIKKHNKAINHDAL